MGAASWCGRGLASLVQHLALARALNLEPSLLSSQTHGPKKHRCSAVMGHRGRGGFLPPALCPLLLAGTALPLPLSPAAGQGQALAVPCHLLPEEPCSPASKVGSSPQPPSGTCPSPYRAPSVGGREAGPSLRVSPQQAVLASHRQGPGLGPDGGCGLRVVGGVPVGDPGAARVQVGGSKTRVDSGQDGAHVGSRPLWGSVG